ncbi:MAG: FAD-linked oxidase [Flavobacteriales bacterium]|nr:FAD-linked oxidase [Flavobacteriales bacterium]
MATTNTSNPGKWDTFHNNGPWDTRTLYKTTIDGTLEQTSFFDCYNDAANEIQRLLEIARKDKHGFRAMGAAWSLNHIAHHKDNMHFNRGMNLCKIIAASEVHAESPYKAENLFFFQCGTRVKEMNNFLFKFRKSLKTTGASNGQTIAGCISTGVHGSAHDVGSMQDYVVGLSLIIGPGNTDRVYLERKNSKALSDQFAKDIKSRVIRTDDDALFNAALVGLGSFGFIHGVVVEVEDLYLLNRYVTTIERKEAMRLASTLDFENSTFKIAGEKNAQGKPNRPHHYKIFINPYRNEPELVAEMMYKKPYRTDYPDPIPRVKTAIYTDLVINLGKVLGKIPKRIPGIIRLLEKSVLPKEGADPNKPVTGTHGEIFWDSIHQGPAYACEVCIDIKDAPKALNLLCKLAKEEGPIPGLFAMRFIKQSKATLACSAFPVSCMLEIDGAIWKAKKGDMGLKEFCTRSITVLKANHIPFTIHWGKNADWAYPGLVEHMYGSKAKQWRECRSALLTKEMAKVFSNGFLDETGLSQYVDNAPASLAENTV